MSSITASDHPFISVTYWILRKVIGFPVRLLLIREVTGLSRIPKSGAAILAFNHQSFFDFICFVAVAPRNVHFLAAEKFFEHWLWRLLMVFTGQIKVDKEHALKYLADGCELTEEFLPSDAKIFDLTDKDKGDFVLNFSELRKTVPELKAAWSREVLRFDLNIIKKLGYDAVKFNDALGETIVK